MLGFGSLSVPVRLYVLGFTVATAFLAIGYVLRPFPSTVSPESVPTVLAVFSVLGLFAELKPTTTPAGDKKTVFASVVIAAILLVGPSYALIPVIICQVVYHLISRQPFPKLLFNTADFALTTVLSGIAYRWVLGNFGLQPSLTFDSLPEVVALAALIAVYYVANTIPVAIVLALGQQRPVLDQYREAYVEVALGVYAAEAVIGVIAAMLWGVAPWSLVLVGFVVMIVYLAYSLSASLQMAQRDLLKRMAELQRRTTELELLNEVNNALTRALDLTQLWQLLSEQVGRLLDTTTFMVALYDEQRAEIEIAYGHDEGTQSTGQVLPAGTGISGWVVANAQPLLIRDYEEERGSFPDPVRWGKGNLPQSILAVPMILDGRVLGVISAQAYRPDAYGEDDLRLLGAIAAQAAVAVNSARLRKQAAEAEALRHLNVLKTQFVSTVSHELRSPLTPIVGYSEILTMGGFGEEQVREMAEEINRSALHMERLIEDLLDLSRIEAGRLKLAVRATQLEELIDDAVRDQSTRSTRHRIQAEIDDELPELRVDPVRIKQVLDNLLSNAVKYSPDGGDVLVRARLDGDEVRISVSDQGVGVSPDKLSRLFEMFYRVDSEQTRRVRGTGLGLAISKNLVEAHGGRIWAESQVGRGSTFYFSLPVAGLEPDAVAALSLDSPKNGGA